MFDRFSEADAHVVCSATWATAGEVSIYLSDNSILGAPSVSRARNLNSGGAILLCILEPRPSSSRRSKTLLLQRYAVLFSHPYRQSMLLF
jgi:hypothetical protein